MRSGNTTPPRESLGCAEAGQSVCPSARPATASTVLLSPHQQLSFPEKTLISQEHQRTLLAALPVLLLILAES